MVDYVRKFTLRTDRKEMARDEVIEKWSGEEGLERVYPDGQEKVGKHVKRILRDLCLEPICEVGCGDGRIARLFQGCNYKGLDINEVAIEKARYKLGHNIIFRHIKWDDPYPKASTYLFYTVLLHIPDDEIFDVIKKTENRVVVAEPMNRWAREYGLSDNFQRDPNEYRSMFRLNGMEEKAFYHVHLPYFPFYIHIVVYE